MVTHLRQQITGNDRFAARLCNDFATRAVELARQAHLDGTAHMLSLRSATIEFVVPARNRSTEHVVICDFAGSVWCDCLAAARFNRACSHAGAAILYLRLIAQACAAYTEVTDAPDARARARPPDEGWQWWLAGGAW